MNRLLILLPLLLPNILFCQFGDTKVISQNLGFLNTVETGDMDKDGDIDIIARSNLGLFWFKNDNDFFNQVDTIELGDVRVLI